MHCPRRKSFNALRALGSSSTVELREGRALPTFQCTSCFGVFINIVRLRVTGPTHVSMHFVLWGLHQLTTEAHPRRMDLFQCTSCFGVFINRAVQAPRPFHLSFNALRALGSSSTTVSLGEGNVESFNALRALGSSSTLPASRSQHGDEVSMHFVLWGLHQLRSNSATLKLCFL